MEQPIKYWVPSIAPSVDVALSGEICSLKWKGDLFISALVPGDVRRLQMDGQVVISEDILWSEFGRIRFIGEAPDGSLILATDGKEGKLVRISAPQ